MLTLGAAVAHGSPVWIPKLVMLFERLMSPDGFRDVEPNMFWLDNMQTRANDQSSVAPNYEEDWWCQAVPNNIPRGKWRSGVQEDEVPAPVVAHFKRVIPLCLLSCLISFLASSRIPGPTFQNLTGPVTTSMDSPIACTLSTNGHTRVWRKLTKTTSRSTSS